MSIVKRLAGVAMLFLTFAAAAPVDLSAQAQAPSTTAAQDEYVPIDELPEGEKLPAAPFLIGAYTVLWLAILVYLLMLWRRLGRVEHELQEARRATGGR